MKIKSLRDIIAVIVFGVMEFFWNLFMFFKELWKCFAELFKEVYDFFNLHLYKVEKFKPKPYTLE